MFGDETVDWGAEEIARTEGLWAQMEVWIPPSAWQTRQIMQVLEYFDVFSDLPGMVQEVKHHIRTPKGVVVRTPLKPTPLALKDVLEREVQTMLRLGVIIESTSLWCSPPILVPKPDGSV